MDAKQIKRLSPMLNKYLRQFDDCFGHIEPVERLKAYVTGQLSDLQQKSIEPMADAAGLPSSRSFFSTGSVFMADRSGKGKVTGRSSRNYHRNTTVYSSFSPLPRKEQAEAIA